MYLAVRGGGAFCNGKPIHASTVSDPDDAIYAMSFAARLPEEHDHMLRVLNRVMGSCNDLRRMGSAAFDLCCAACGRTEGFFELGLHIYRCV